MRSAKTRALSLLLALMIVVGLSPGTAWAASFDGFFSSVPVQASNGTGATAWSPIEEDGVPVLRSPSGKSYSSCDITLTITADTEISFEYRISSKEGSDYFKIEQNGTALTEKTTPGFSGEVGWTTYHLPVNNGDKLVLGYKKSGTTSAGSDRMWLRNFAAGEGVTVTFHNGNETDTQKIYGEKGTLKANTFMPCACKTSKA